MREGKIPTNSEFQESADNNYRELCQAISSLVPDDGVGHVLQRDGGVLKLLVDRAFLPTLQKLFDDTFSRVSNDKRFTNVRALPTERHSLAAELVKPTADITTIEIHFTKDY